MGWFFLVEGCIEKKLNCKERKLPVEVIKSVSRFGQTIMMMTITTATKKKTTKPTKYKDNNQDIYEDNQKDNHQEDQKDEHKDDHKDINKDYNKKEDNHKDYQKEYIFVLFFSFHFERWIGLL